MSLFGRLWRRWFLHRRISPQLVRQIEADIQPIAVGLNWPPWLILPVNMSASGDILFAAQCRQTSNCLAMLRYSPHPAELATDQNIRESTRFQLPRHRLYGTEKILHESECYRKLAACDLTPRILFASNHLLMNSWSSAVRLSDRLRQNGGEVWVWLPIVLAGITSMHQKGMVHLDLNCGNILVDDARHCIQFIDFEYRPLQSVSTSASMAFDYVRFLHGILQRRRGGQAVRRDINRFLAVVREHIPAEIRGAMAVLPASWLGRCDEILEFRNEIAKQ